MQSDLLLSIFLCAAILLLCRLVKTYCKKILFQENCLL